MPPSGLAPHDAHVHGWPPDATSAPSPTRPDVEELLRAMDATGVDRAALVTPEGVDNQSLLRACLAHADRLAPVARIASPSSGDETTVRALADAGVAGLRVVAMDGAAARMPDLPEFWAAVRDAGVPVTLHTTADGLASVGAVAARWPDVALVVDHLGRPDVAAGVAAPGFRALLALARHRNVSVKTPNSAYFSAVPVPYQDLLPFLAAAVTAFGEQRLIWGSDWPTGAGSRDYSAAFEPTVAALATASEDARHAVFRGNFERLFRGWRG